MHSIHICSFYQQQAPNSIIPEPLKESDLLQIAENPAMLKWYKPEDLNFWTNCKRNSIAYLENNESFEKEGNILT